MRIHPLCLLLVVAVPALVTATTYTSCIVGCTCDVVYSRKLKIENCDNPLILTKNALDVFPKEISVISFKNVVIAQIEDNAFTGFEEVANVVIADSTIQSLGAKAFESLPELNVVTFVRTKFAESPLLSSEYLEELIFNDCDLSQVPNLDKLPGLRLLNVANNLIETIDDKTFIATSDLESVNLANNSITELSPKLFAENRDLTDLTLDYNPVTSLDFLTEPKLEILSLKHCQISTLDRRTTENFALLNTLDLSGNGISVLPIDAFEPMKELHDLDLSNNKLVELDDDIFLENNELDHIVLDNNQLERLPQFQTKIRGNTFHTRTFSCKNCGLKTIEGAFENMRELVTLDLSNNRLSDIDRVFAEMSSIKEIILSHNEIASIGVNSFGKNPNLETLDLSNNPLLPLDPVLLASLPSLKKLNLSGSRLKSLWANHNAVLSSLEQLLIDHNLLTEVTFGDMKIIPNYKLVNLQDNPIECDNLQQLMEDLTANSMYPKDLDTKTHEEIKLDAEITYKPSWNSILLSNCEFENDIIDDETIDDDGDDDDDDDDDDVDGVDIDDDDNVANYDEDEKGVEEPDLTTNGFNLAKASYILSITSVFILTALLVLFVAVVITLLILKRNRAFNMHNSNLPRLKIPLWHTTPGQKKHSGSVYRPLSEELSGPRTPIINRYEFKQTPSVHNSLP